MSEFEKHRDLLIQEISNSINSIVLNLNVLNRSLNNSIQVSKDFENVSNLWLNFYDGAKQHAPQDDDASDEPPQDEQQPESIDSQQNEPMDLDSQSQSQS